MKINHLLLLLLCVMLSCGNKGCACKGCQEYNPKTLKEKLQGKSFVMLKVTEGNNDVTPNFANFKITFIADGKKTQVITGGTNSETKLADINIAETSIILLNNIPTDWENTITNVEADEYGLDVKFQVAIKGITYKFALWRQ
jgi:hypothetical protein